MPIFGKVHKRRKCMNNTMKWKYEKQAKLSELYRRTKVTPKIVYEKH